MNSKVKAIFGLMVSLMAGLPLQGCCSPASEGATASLMAGRQDMEELSDIIHSEDGKAWMETDTVHFALIGRYVADGKELVDTLKRYTPELEIYPKRVHAIEASDSSMVYLFIYSCGHLLNYDEAQTYVYDEYGFRPLTLFLYEYQWDCRVSCMWYDQLVAASDGFPYDYEEEDHDRFGIHYDVPSRNLYIPKMEHHEKGSEFENCLRYTGRFDILHFDGEEFTLAYKDDGAWWLHPDLRNYKRTISNRKTDEGYEQIDLMPDGTYRHAMWKGAESLDDLRRKPDKVKMTSASSF